MTDLIKRMVQGVASIAVWTVIIWATFIFLIKIQNRLGSPMPVFLEHFLTGMTGALWALGLAALITYVFKRNTPRVSE